jgi:hypothetical protein
LALAENLEGAIERRKELKAGLSDMLDNVERQERGRNES